MSKLMKITLIQVCAWSIVAISMIIIFLNHGTIENWGDNTTKTILLALLFFIGYATHFTTLLIEKSKRWGFKKDERDLAIQSKAVNIGFIVVLMYIFILSISLYIKYETVGMMPVGWVWFIAYSTVVMANLSVTIPSLLIYRKQGY